MGALKVNIQKMKSFIKRFIPVLTAVLVLVCCFSFPVGASSSTVSYLDLDPNITVDGENNLIRLYVPSEYWNISLRNTNNDILATVTDGEALSYWLEQGKGYRIDVYFFLNTHFSVKGLPDDTRITISWDSEQGMVLLPPPNFMQETWYYDSTGNEVSWSGSTYSPSAYQGEVSFDFYIMPESVPYASSMSFGGNFAHGTALGSGTFNYWIEYVLLEFSISSFLVSQQMTGQNTELLNEVKNQLAQQGKTMDDILNGTPGQQDKVDNVVGDIEDSLDDFQNSMDDMADATLPTIDFDEYVPFELLGQPFIHFANVLGSFWWNSVLARFMSILGGIILISFILFGEKH